MISINTKVKILTVDGSMFSRDCIGKIGIVVDHYRYSQGEQTIYYPYVKLNGKVECFRPEQLMIIKVQRNLPEWF